MSVLYSKSLTFYELSPPFCFPVNFQKSNFAYILWTLGEYIFVRLYYWHTLHFSICISLTYIQLYISHHPFIS